MRVLILGGTNFIGPDVVRHLVADGHAMTVFHRGKTEADLPPGVAHLHGDRRNLAAFGEEFRRAAPETVLDMRPLGEADARAVVDAFRGIARRVVAISSQDVYRAYDRINRRDPGPPDPIPLTEEAPLREKLFPYRGEAERAEDDPMRWADEYDKILVERVVLGNPDLAGTALRLPAVYGPRDGQRRFFNYLKRMDDGRPAILVPASLAAWRWSRGYVENVAAAIARAVADDRAAGRVYNVAEPDSLPEADLVRLLGRVAGWAGEVVTVEDEALPEGMRTGIDASQELIVDTSRIRTELGYVEAVPREEALERTIAWERAHPPAEVDPAQFDYAAEDEILARVRSGR